MQKQTFLNKLGHKAVVLGAAAGASVPAMAADIDTSAITTSINGVVPVITAVGMALISVYVVVKAFRMVVSFIGR